jgi:hypothetical protein
MKRIVFVTPVGNFGRNLKDEEDLKQVTERFNDTSIPTMILESDADQLKPEGGNIILGSIFHIYKDKIVLMNVIEVSTLTVSSEMPRISLHQH